MSEVLITPVWNPNRGHHQFAIGEIYGHSPTGTQVPNKDDIVYDVAGHRMYRVLRVPESGIAELTTWVPKGKEALVEGEDGFVGGGPSPISNSFNAYIDYSVTPAVLTVDSRVRTYSSQATYVKIFLGGTDINSERDVVSMYYTDSLDHPDNRIPLVGKETGEGRSSAIKVPLAGYCNRDISHGAELTMVEYTAADQALRSTRLRVFRTETVRRTNAAAKYITGIHLESPYASEIDDDVIRIPVNTELAAANFIGVVEYNDGDRVELPIGAGRISVVGMDGWKADYPGDRIDVTLRYRLGDNEYTAEGMAGAAGLLSKRYYIEGTVGNESGDVLSPGYGVKLHALPMWNHGTKTYDLEFWLTSITRDRTYNVTPFVEMEDDIRWNGQSIGIRQRFVVAVDLSRVHASFSTYRHTEIIDITLNRAGYTRYYPIWTAAYDVHQYPRYGSHNTFWANRVMYQPTETYQTPTGPVEQPVGDPYEVWEGVMTSGAATISDWLARIMYAAKPIYDPVREVNAPIPNYVRLYDGGTLLEEVALYNSDWTETFRLPVTLGFSETIRLEFIRRVATDNSDPQDIDPIVVHDHEGEVVGYMEAPALDASTVDYVVGIGMLQLIDQSQVT